jgi:hypothetical protein
MTTVLDSSTPRLILNSRLAWVQEPREYLSADCSKDEVFGIYSFGGIDDTTGKCTNDLFLLQPLTHENMKVISLN